MLPETRNKDTMKIVIELEYNEAHKLLSLISEALPTQAIAEAIAKKVPDVLGYLPSSDIQADEFGMAKIRVACRSPDLIASIKRSREILGLGLKESKEFAEGSVQLYVSKQKAVELKMCLSGLGAVVEIF